MPHPRPPAGRRGLPRAPPPTAALILLVVATAVAATTAAAAAAAAPPTPPVLLRTGVAHPAGPSRRALLALAAPLAGLPPPPEADPADPRWGPLAGGDLFILALRAGADPAAARAAATAAGGVPSLPLPENALLAILPAGGSAARALAASPPIGWVAPFAPAYKVAPEWEAVLEWATGLGSDGDDEGGGGVADGSEARPARAAAVGPPEPGKAAAPYLRPPQPLPRPAGNATAMAFSSLPSAAWTVEVLVTFPPLGPFPEGSAPPVPSQPYAPAAAAAAAWAPALQRICGGACALTPSDSPSASRLAISAPAALSPALVPWLAASPSTHWLSPRARARPRNFFAAGICQAGAPGRVDVSTGTVWAPAPGTPPPTPHWAAGLRGGGQCLGMGDTGLDADHCAFRDPAVPGPGAPGAAAPRAGPDGVKAWESTTHRKLRYYRLLADGLDANGHGTHCAGSAVGAPLASAPPAAAPWGGLAPAARIAFTDLGSGPAGDLAVPLDLGANYFTHHYSRGARVHSDSWGTDATAYDDMAWDFDAFTHANPDFLPLIAAGNDGADGGDGSVTSPAVCKNGLAVGATLTSPFSGSPEFEAVSERRAGEAVQVSVSGAGPRPGGGAHRALAATFGPALPLDPATPRRLVAASPPDACAPLTGPASRWAGALVLASRGNCSFAAKAAAGGAAGAAGMLVSNNGPGGLVRAAAPSTGAPPGPLAPTATLSAASGRDLLAVLQAGANLTAVLGREALPTDRFHSLAYFSSTGPTPDGRTKPDLVAPGTTVSAFSDGDPGSSNCGLGVDRGTSMACPVAAGGALLARQYFSEGWHATGAPNASHAIARPSAALLRAVLIGGAAPMGGVRPSRSGAVDGAPLEAGASEGGPSASVGHGRLHLGWALPLAPLNATNWGLAFAEGGGGATILRAQGAAARFCVRASPGRRPLSVTLAWTDPPPSPAAASPLVNDLDLTVVTEAAPGHPRRGNGGPTPDRANTLERVWLEDGGGREVVITVTAARLPAPPQAFALAVHGGLASPLRAGPACTPLPIPTITASPRPLTNATTARFAWNAMPAPPAGWECRLAGPGGATAPPPLRPWSACAAPPLAVAGLGDGPHEFSVRAAGYSLADAVAFTVDATPPVAVVTSAATPPAGAPRAAAFGFSLAAASPPEPGGVAFACRLTRTAPPAGRPSEPVPLVTGGGPVGAWSPCTSPVRYQALGPGAWAFAVRATDGAGNGQAAPPASVAWRVALPRVAALANAATGPAAAARGAASFTFTAAGGESGGGSPPDAFLCQLSVWEEAAGEYTPASPPAPCASPASFSGLARGRYRFAVALVDGFNVTAPPPPSTNSSGSSSSGLAWPAGALALAAVADFSVEAGADGPAPVLSASPPPFLAPSALPAVFEWGLEGGAAASLPPGAAFACLLQGPPAAGLPGEFTSPCASPASFPALPDGSYAFRVALQAPDGSRGPSASAAFVVDGAGPGVEGVGWSRVGGGTARALRPLAGTLCSVAAPAPAALRALPSASDGVLGSGVASLWCRVLVDDTSGGGSSVAGAGGRAPGGGGGAATPQGRGGRPAPSSLSSFSALATDALATSPPPWEPCTAGFNLTLASPGNHALEVKAVDAAGNEGEAVACGVSLTGDGSGVVGGGGGRAAAIGAGVAAGVALLASLGLLGLRRSA